MFGVNCEDDVRRGTGQRKANRSGAANRGVLIMEVADSIKGMVQTGERFPGVIEGGVTLPMDFVKRALPHDLMANDAVHIEFFGVVNDYCGWGRMFRQLVMRGRFCIGRKEDFIEDRMKTRPCIRQVKLERRKTMLLDDGEGTVSF
jgi:hypothetical protein